MVKTSPRFRDYWLSIHHEDDFITEDESDFLELDDFVSSEQIQSPPSKDKKHGTDLVIVIKLGVVLFD